MRQARGTCLAAAAATALAALGSVGDRRETWFPAATRPAWAQAFDVERPRTLVVGAPAGGARVDRVDVGRSGRSTTALPRSGLRKAWRASLAVLLERAPLVDTRGSTYVVSARGEVVALGRDGNERWRVSTVATQAGPPAMLADGTIVFVDAANEAIAVREGSVRWRVRAGPDDRRGEAARAAPLPLEDGGVVVATSHDLVALDAEGRERARTTLPELTFAPLVAALGKVVAVTASGAVWTWTPGAPEPTRVASFGGAIDGSAALANARTLVAVTAARAHLTAVDLINGSKTTRAVAPADTVWLGPPAMQGETAHLLFLSSGGELADEVIVAAGARRTDGGVEPAPPSPRLLQARAQPTSADAGAIPHAWFPHTPPLVDGAGTLAFATFAGDVGVASAGGVELLVDVCGPGPVTSAAEAAGAVPLPGRTAPAVIAGLAPLGPGAFVAVCRSGAVVAVRGASAVGESPAPHL